MVGQIGIGSPIASQGSPRSAEEAYYRLGVGAVAELLDRLQLARWKIEDGIEFDIPQHAEGNRQYYRVVRSDEGLRSEGAPEIRTVW